MKDAAKTEPLQNGNIQLRRGWRKERRKMYNRSDPMKNMYHCSTLFYSILRIFEEINLQILHKQAISRTKTLHDYQASRIVEFAIFLDFIAYLFSW